MINSNFRAMIGYDEILIEISMDKVSIYKYKKIQYTEKCLTFNSKLAGM